MIDPRVWVETGPAFTGAKVALLAGDNVAVLRRDDIPGIPWPGRIDLPGGGREGNESGAICAFRETHEEIGLNISLDRLTWARLFPNSSGSLPGWFLVARLRPEEPNMMRLGSEGQDCWMMPSEQFLTSAETIPFLSERLGIALKCLDAVV